MNDTAAYTRHPVRLVRTQPLWIPELGTVRAGFPSPAEDLGAKRIDLAEKLIRHPQATFYWRARGHAMQELGISDGDLLIVGVALHNEIPFELDICEHLAAHGWLYAAPGTAGDACSCDTPRALYPADLLA